MRFLKWCMFWIVLNYFQIPTSSDFTTPGLGEKFEDYGITEDSEITEDFTNTEASFLSEETTKYPANLSLTLKMATECETPNHDVGYCVGIKQCTKLYKQLNNPDAKAFLRESMCGPANEDKKNPKVCCGKYDNSKSSRRNVVPVEDNKIFPKECGRQKMVIRGRIFGGTQASLGEFPWMARLLHKNKYGYKSYGCSGFLIHSKYVLTAAHCIHSNFTKIRGPVFSVVLGDHTSNTKIDCSPNGVYCADAPQISRAAKVIVHPKYDPQSNAHYNDIALVHLNKGARMTEYVKPICLLSDPNEVASKYFLSGWGKTETEQVSRTKMKVDIPPYDKQNCQEKYSLWGIRIADTQLCAGAEGGKDSCTGDSGGPLMMTPNGTVWFAAGIVSYGIGCGLEGWPGIYTNIPSFIPWIKEQILKNSLLRTKSSAVKKHRKKKKKIVSRVL
nr:serine protease 7-like [Leptinotarsa decemlineata]